MADKVRALRLTASASEVLDLVAPSRYARGRFVSQLIGEWVAREMERERFMQRLHERQQEETAYASEAG